jgi:hypothetical protein
MVPESRTDFGSGGTSYKGPVGQANGLGVGRKMKMNYGGGALRRRSGPPFLDVVGMLVVEQTLPRRKHAGFEEKKRERLRQCLETEMQEI